MCSDKKASVLFKPCGHMCACDGRPHCVERSVTNALCSSPNGSRVRGRQLCADH